ncbi:MAG: TFIIB-type zinc ribbon-containing protein [archaeon]
MICPDCKSEEILKSSDGIFCKKCGLELEEGTFISGKGRGNDREIASLPQIEFMIDPKIELFSLKLCLKNNKLAPDAIFNLGLDIKEYDSSKKEAVKSAIDAMFKKNAAVLLSSKERLEKNWRTIERRYFYEMEKMFNLEWNSLNYKCYLSIVCSGGFHNSTNDQIIIQHRWGKASNYVIAHEMFHILFRNYINRFFKEKYDEFDEELSESLVNIVLLIKLKSVFSNYEFSLDAYSAKHREMAEQILKLGTEKSMKEIVIVSYSLFGKQKTWISY